MNYAKIVPCDIANGEGVRVTLFVQGCTHHCPGCQNPTTWDPNGGQPFTDESLDKIAWIAQIGLPIPLHAYFDVFDGTIQMVIFVMLTMINIKVVAEH